MRRLMGWLRGGGDELGWDDLVRRAVDAVAGLARFGARGRVAFPPQVEVVIVVPPDAVEIMRGFVARPDFDREVGAALANRCDTAVGDLPGRQFRIEEGPRAAVRAVEAAPASWQLQVVGGDRDGSVFAMPAGRGEIAFGRGDWHGGHDARNQLVVCDRTEFVSRRAGRVHSLGGRLEIESLDQGDFLAIRRADGAVVRPARTPTGRAAVGDGDVIEIVDGRDRDRAVRLIVRRA